MRNARRGRRQSRARDAELVSFRLRNNTPEETGDRVRVATAERPRSRVAMTASLPANWDSRGSSFWGTRLGIPKVTTMWAWGFGTAVTRAELFVALVVYGSVAGSAVRIVTTRMSTLRMKTQAGKMSSIQGTMPGRSGANGAGGDAERDEPRRRTSLDGAERSQVVDSAKLRPSASRR